MTDEDITRIHQRLDEIAALEKRIRAIEIWQAYQTGRLTALAVFFSALGAIILWGGTLLSRHFKLLLLSLAALCLVMLSGCAGTTRPQHPLTVATTQAHVERTAAYVSSAANSTAAARRGVSKVESASMAASAAANRIDSAAVRAEVQARLQEVQIAAHEAGAEMEQVAVALSAAQAEEAQTKTALADTQIKITALESDNVTLTKDRDDALDHSKSLKKSNDALAGRLSRLAFIIAGCAAAFVWVLSRSLGLAALPIPYRYAWPGVAAAAAGVATFTYLRWFL